MSMPGDVAPAATGRRRDTDELERRLHEAEETLDAIQRGHIDAVVVNGPHGPRIYALETAERPYRLLIEQMQEGAFTLDADGTVLYCSRRLLQMLDLPEEQVVGATLGAMLSPSQPERLDALIAQCAGGAASAEFVLVRPDGTTVPVHLSLIDIPGRDPRALCGVLTDLTDLSEQTARARELADANARLSAESEERARAEAQLRQAQKMEAVGQLTGGLAHDFNNLLTVILGHLQILEDRMPGDAALAPHVRHALAAAERGSRLTQQLLAFSRRQTLRPVPVRVCDLLPDLESLLQHTLGANIEVRITCAEGVWHCLTDANQLGSAVLNLAINARDAMQDGGLLTVAAANVELDAAAAAATAIPDVSAGRYVTITVADTGTGMTPDVKARAFEPFFTTKAVGSGSGLGLSMVYGFVRQSGGFVALDSTPGGGTTVRLFLPWTEPPAEAPRAAPAAATAAGGTTKVLIVEDDADVRHLARLFLEEMGHTVLTAPNGRDALALLDRHPAIGLLFSDIAMPGGMSGIDLARMARRRHPGIGVLLTSGYVAQHLIGEGNLAEEFTFLRKPYDDTELAEAIRTALSARPRPGAD